MTKENPYKVLDDILFSFKQGDLYIDFTRTEIKREVKDKYNINPFIFYAALDKLIKEGYISKTEAQGETEEYYTLLYEGILLIYDDGYVVMKNKEKANDSRKDRNEKIVTAGAVFGIVYVIYEVLPVIYCWISKLFHLC